MIHNLQVTKEKIEFYYHQSLFKREKAQRGILYLSKHFFDETNKNWRYEGKLREVTKGCD